jgi:PleD family two-component response regulator
VTCSVGLACWDFQEHAANLVERADQALYLAKAGGRNRHVLAS